MGIEEFQVAFHIQLAEIGGQQQVVALFHGLAVHGAFAVQDADIDEGSLEVPGSLTVQFHAVNAVVLAGNQMMHIVNAIGEYLSFTDASAIIQNCFDYDLISEKKAKLIMAALSEKSLPVKQPEQDYLRARILKNMLITIA